MLDADQIEGWEDGVPLTDMGPWAQTQSGGRFYPLAPEHSDFSLTDVAHHLSMVNRYSGATVYPFSVAQHLLLCRALAAFAWPKDELLRKWALVHDLPEYMLGDHIRPVKRTLADFEPMEDRAMRAMADWLGLAPLDANGVKELRAIDMMSCAIEKRALCPNSEQWGGIPDPIDGFDIWTFETPWRDVRRYFGRALTQEFPGR